MPISDLPADAAAAGIRVPVAHGGDQLLACRARRHHIRPGEMSNVSPLNLTWPQQVRGASAGQSYRPSGSHE
jgi:hypothetical protein